MSDKFSEIFQQQKEYNKKIRSREPGISLENWTEKYLLGLISEVDDVLDSIRWKKHRRNGVSYYYNRPNLLNDFADLTKYVLSLWELWGFHPEVILKAIEDKSNTLDEIYRQEFEEIPEDRLIVISDIDGTLGDWRRTFMDWALAIHSIEASTQDPVTNLQIDSDLALRYPDYFRLKESFESNGNYAHIWVYQEAKEFLDWLREEFDAYIIAHTARPWQKYYRIWADTWTWIVEKQLPIDQLRIGSESRVLLATELGGVNVLMLEDDPGLMLRAAHSGISVIARSHPYNNGVEHAKIYKVDSFIDAKERIQNDFRTYIRGKSTGQRVQSS